MPTGNDEADLFWKTVQGSPTELPFISIAAETWRAFRDLGEVLFDINHSPPAVSKLAKRLKEEAPPLRRDLLRSMELDAVPAGVAGPRCRPYVAGTQTCGMLPRSVVSSNRASEAWRTYR